MINLNELPVQNGVVDLTDLTPVTPEPVQPTASLEDKYQVLCAAIDELTNEQDQGMLCKQFATAHGLIFIGFNSGTPRFHEVK